LALDVHAALVAAGLLGQVEPYRSAAESACRPSGRGATQHSSSVRRPTRKTRRGRLDVTLNELHFTDNLAGVPLLNVYYSGDNFTVGWRNSAGIRRSSSSSFRPGWERHAGFPPGDRGRLLGADQPQRRLGCGAAGGSGADTLYGSGGRDWMDGGPDGDALYGFGGDDRCGYYLARTTRPRTALCGPGARRPHRRRVERPVRLVVRPGAGHHGAYDAQAVAIRTAPLSLASSSIRPPACSTTTPRRTVRARRHGHEPHAGREAGGRPARRPPLWRTGLDFLYGYGGDDTIYTRDGEEFENAFGVPAATHGRNTRSRPTRSGTTGHER